MSTLSEAKAMTQRGSPRTWRSGIFSMPMTMERAVSRMRVVASR
jgi:hypothetical protein